MKKEPEFVDGLIKGLNPPKALSAEKEKKIKEAIRLKNLPPTIPEPIVPLIQTEDDPALEAIKKVEMNDCDILQSMD